MSKPFLRVVGGNDNVVAMQTAAPPTLPGYNVRAALFAAAKSAAAIGRAAGSVTLQAVHYLVFYALMWARIPLVMLCYGCVAIGVLGVILAAILKPEFALMWKLGLFSFFAFAVLMLYDALVVLVTPRNYVAY